MKTAISVPDEVFKQAERYAKQTGLSRSELYAKALAEYLEAHRRSRITEKLNAVYATEDSRLDPVLEKMQWASLPKEKW